MLLVINVKYTVIKSAMSRVPLSVCKSGGGVGKDMFGYRSIVSGYLSLLSTSPGLFQYKMLRSQNNNILVSDYSLCHIFNIV